MKHLIVMLLMFVGFSVSIEADTVVQDFDVGIVNVDIVQVDVLFPLLIPLERINNINFYEPITTYLEVEKVKLSYKKIDKVNLKRSGKRPRDGLTSMG